MAIFDICIPVKIVSRGETHIAGETLSTFRNARDEIIIVTLRAKSREEALAKFQDRIKVIAYGKTE